MSTSGQLQAHARMLAAAFSSQGQRLYDGDLAPNDTQGADDDHFLVVPTLELLKKVDGHWEHLAWLGGTTSSDGTTLLYEPVTDGDDTDPQVLFEDGDIIMEFVEDE